MKLIFSGIAAVLATTSVFSARPAVAEPCTGPFRQCAVSVNATCSRDADGRQRMTYWDYPGNTIQFDRCVGGVFEAAGQPNPYTGSGGAARGRNAGLTMPYTELLYPMQPNR